MLARLTPFFALMAILVCPLFAKADQTLLEIAKDLDPALLKTQNAKVSVNDKALLMTTGHEGDQASVAVRAPSPFWNLTKFQDIAVEVKNVGDHNVTVHCRVDSTTAADENQNLDESVPLTPGETKVIRVFMSRRVSREMRAKLFGMRGIPNQVWVPNFDSMRVTQVVVYVDKPAANARLEIGDIRACESHDKDATFPDDKLLPMIDPFGQYIYRDWPGKVHSLQELTDNRKKEADDIAAHPGPKDRDQYGGWKGGPKLKATGFFRTEKVAGKWWFVDPEGNLFWSYGMNGVGVDSGRTPLTHRKEWYVDLPKPGSPLTEFLGGRAVAEYNTDGKSPSWKYYWGKDSEWFDFSGANLKRKYGDDWQKTFFGFMPQRLRSWGLNSLGCGSDHDKIGPEKVPYVMMFSCSSKRLAGSEGYWAPFPDVFDPEFIVDARKKVTSYKENDRFKDPWCLGIFVENEISWGSDSTSLAVAALRSPPEQAAKIAFIDDLKKKYGDINKLNEVWGSEYASWDALSQSTATPNKNKAKDDLEAFYNRTADHYFKVTNDVLREVDPNHLNLGCRFAAWAQNPSASRASAKFCDVVSFNNYKHTTENLKLPDDCDKPILIGEFHFGALDRGMFHTGLVGTGSQDERAQAFKSYMEGAIDSPAIIGAHWFELRDQATTARGDGENYQIGFVDICDTPNPEIIKAAREVGDELYQRRNGK